MITQNSDSLSAPLSLPTAVNDLNGGNKLFPVFLKLESLRLVIIGGGNVGLEKTRTILQNSPGTTIKVVGREICSELIRLRNQHHFEIITAPYETWHLDAADIVIVAVNNKQLSAAIRADAKAFGLLVNIADTPSLCDFYLGSIVQKGNVKIAVSTNGKSPTIAKRIKENLQVWLPDDIDTLLENMNVIRGNLDGDFSAKVKALNRITNDMIVAGNYKTSSRRRLLTIAACMLFGFVGVLLVWNIILFYSQAPF
ncbi:MAG: bifunctional precorrin-2 dehydrogenase/sirohydrochlorin ferrochelatase [Flavipsychrobacter sp.]|nr:bifunctional precorrin-2 dehydrogenase/sirohydrochlorin ferrochelatase [Flavipsychrobacter sp.]